MPLPRDLLDEVEMELDAARSSLTRNRARTTLLEELHPLVIAVSQEFGGPITVFDFIRSAATCNDRERRLALIRLLRTDTHEQTPQRSSNGQSAG